VIDAVDLQGHWRRDWLRAPGLEDRETRVHWLQAGTIFADLRVPLVRPDLGSASCLADLPASAHLALLEAEGFAGHITVADGVCTWHREINWHGCSTRIDAGAMAFEAPGIVIETGIHADYSERWVAEAGPALHRQRVRAAGREGVLVASLSVFRLALDDPKAAPSNGLRSALEHNRLPRSLSDRYRGAYIFGAWQGDSGIATLSVNPFDMGRRVLSRSESGFVWHHQDWVGQLRVLPLEDPSRSGDDGQCSG